MRTLILTLALSAAICVNAQWSTDPALNLPLSDTNYNGSAQTPKAVSGGNGGAIIVWSRGIIKGQRVNSGGQKLWEPTAEERDVSPWGEPLLPYVVNPVAVSDDSGGAIVAYSEFGSSDFLMGEAAQSGKEKELLRMK